MVFSSLMFLFIFLPLVLAVYYLLPRKFRNLFLLVADIFFYGWGEPVLILLMIFSIIINYFAGLLIERFELDDKKKKIVLILSVIIDLGLLAFFKYAGFFARTINLVIPFTSIPVLEIPLPIGISFYTFQIMSYTIDVYRKDTKAQHSLIAFGTYVSLFPQLIAGPIVRYRDVDVQLTGRTESLDQFAHGIKVFALGLVKKVLIANSMGLLWDSLREISDGGAVASWIGIIAYSFQIYFDFSGYSDMAVGLGYMFGFEFLKNFDYPYISKSITEFWRRWHISLSTWFKEYVYIPLGGNRKGKVRQIFNILIVWMLTGFWHGASANFILWGVYFGVVLIAEKLFLLKALEKIPSVFSHVYSLFVIVFGWVLFYFSDDVGGFKAMSEFIPKLFTGGLVSSDAMHIIIAYAPMLVVAGIASTPVVRKVYGKIKEKKWIGIFDVVCVAVILVLCTASLVSDSYNPFLYFKF